MQKIEWMLATEAVALCAEQVFPITHAVFPMGGSAFAQFAIFMVTGYVWQKLSD